MAACGTSLRFEIQLRIVGDDNNVISGGEILHFDKGDDRLEAIGLSFNEAKATLVGIQGGVVEPDEALTAAPRTARRSGDHQDPEL